MIGGPMIHVSSLSTLNSVTAGLDSFDLLTLLSPDHPETGWREFACTRHLRLAFHDIVEPMPGLIAPNRYLMQAVLDFGRGRDPGFERDIAVELRRRSPSATPNRLMVRLTDDLLQRDGRMVEAIEGIGRGVEVREGEPYVLPLQWPGV